MEKQAIYNYYCTGKNGEELRAVAISGHWRICRRENSYSTTWLFLDDIEYNTASEAMEKYI
ncbi:hypothetical protein ACR77J_07915 [Tissierella praeacuta]|uniref:hypothetical protein n=1 Tax=Tissierella praeacuta TaxID=43131 RepID=UPI003DA28FA8